MGKGWVSAFVIATGIFVGGASSAWAHSMWLEPVPRTEEDFLTEAPCGGVGPMGTPTVYEAGAEVTLRWTVSQSHGNEFRVAFSAGNELGFDANVLGTRPDVDGQTDYEQAVTLPMCVCTACTLQLAQLTVTGNAGYYSCADIALQAPAGVDVPACPIVDDGGGTGGSDGAETGSASVTGGTTTFADDGSAATSAGDDAPGSTNASDEATGAPADDESGGGCGCRTGDRTGLLVLLPVVAFFRRRGWIAAVALSGCGGDDGQADAADETGSSASTTTSSASATDTATSTSGTSAGTSATGATTTSGSDTGSPGDCPMFPPDNPWNTDISGYDVHPDSDAFIASIGADTSLHADFGTFWENAPIGIPWIAVGNDQQKVPVTFEYADESDPGPYPIPSDAPIEGGPDASGDRHVLVLHRDECKLYELFSAYPQDGGASWMAGSGAIFDLTSNALRPDGWTSADAAGLPILPGLVRYDEVVEDGVIDHALRFTVSTSQAGYIHPATHYASDQTDPTLPPMGLRVRLQAGVDCSGLSSEVQVICAALKTYGMFVADNGSDWYVSGDHDPRWNDEALADIGQLHGSDFEVVYTGDVVGP